MKNKLVLAVDIDDTLADTARHTFALAKKTFNHELTVEELLFRYDQPGDVPEWQTSEVAEWLEKHLGSAEYLSTMPLVPAAQSVLSSLSKNFILCCYITSRQHYMKEMTINWLAHHNLPQSTVITRGYYVKEKNWKIIELKKRFESPQYLIDDSLGSIPNELLTHHNGSLLWFNPQGRKSQNSLVKNFASWPEIEEYLLTQ